MNTFCRDHSRLAFKWEPACRLMEHVTRVGQSVPDFVEVEDVGEGLFFGLYGYSVKSEALGRTTRLLVVFMAHCSVSLHTRKIESCCSIPLLPRAQNMIGVGFRTWQLLHMCKRDDIKIEQK